MPVLNLDTAFALDLRNIYENTSFQIVLNKFQDNGTTPENWDDCDYKFTVSPTPDGLIKTMVLAKSNGQITVVNNVLTIICLSTENHMKGNKVYYYNLIADYGNGITRVKGTGSINVNYSII